MGTKHSRTGAQVLNEGSRRSREEKGGPEWQETQRKHVCSEVGKKCLEVAMSTEAALAPPPDVYNGTLGEQRALAHLRKGKEEHLSTGEEDFVCSLKLLLQVSAGSKWGQKHRQC